MKLFFANETKTDEQDSAPETLHSTDMPDSYPAAYGSTPTDEPTTRELSAESDEKPLSENAFLAGITALREVHHASRRTEEARQRLAELQAEIEEDTDELNHRLSIEQNFEQIIARNTADLEQASADEKDAHARGDLASATRSDLIKQLEAMKAKHEEKLGPYRGLMETTKARADDASRALGEARRDAKSAESQEADAVRNRDAAIASANRAVDTARDRLQRAQDELTRAKQSQNTTPSTSDRLLHQVITEQAALDLAKQKVPTVTAEADQRVETAQTYLASRKQILAEVEHQASEAKAEAGARKEEYDGLYKQAMADEEALKKQIAICDSDLEQANDNAAEARERADVAQAALDEANDIHSTPEVTTELHERIANSQEQAATMNAEADSLAQKEHILRTETRGSRALIISIAIVLVIIIVVVIWLLFFSK